jgi:drug/metabolite transporter (DMT)-like permease
MKPVLTTTPDAVTDRSSLDRLRTASGSAAQSSKAGPYDLRLVGALAAVYVIWGSTYLAMRIAVHEGLPPLLSAAVRFLSAGTVLLGYARYRGATMPTWRDVKRVAPVGALLFVGGNGLVSIASQSIHSGGTAVVCATMPLWIGVLGASIGEKPTAREWLSLVVGFVGVLVLLGSPSLAGKPLHIALLIGSPILWAAGSLWARRTKDVGGTQAAFVSPALQMLTGGAALLVLALVRGERFTSDATPHAWMALGYLWVFGSLVAFTAYAWLLRNSRPVVATSYAYVNPILAVLIGATLYNEPLGWTTVVANVLIVGAVMLALTRPSRSGANART